MSTATTVSPRKWGTRFEPLATQPPISPVAEVAEPPERASTMSATPPMTPTKPQSMPGGKMRIPATHCVFAASLPNDQDPVRLRKAIQAAVEEQANIQVTDIKLIDDKYYHKAGFIHTTSQEEAKKLCNSNITVNGQPLRLEPARAHRTLLLSFKDSKSESDRPKSLRVVRKADGYLYVGADGKLPFNMPTTAPDPEDPFSGTGYLLDNLQYTGDELKTLCEAIGPIESWKEVSTYNDLNSSASSCDVYDIDSVTYSQPHTKDAAQGLWECRWICREDSQTAKFVFTALPYVSWSWAHYRGDPSDTSFSPGFHSRSPGYGIRGRGGSRGGRLLNSRKGLLYGEMDRTEGTPFGPRRPVGLYSSQEQYVEKFNTSRYASSSNSEPPSFSITDFPPLVPGNSKSYPEFQSDKESIVMHARSFSDDTPPPETPISLHIESPVIETEHNTLNEPVNLDRLEPTLPSASAAVTAIVASLLSESEAGSSQHHSSGQVGRHDFKALYVFGVPHAGMETQIKETFEKFGKVASVEYMSYRGHGLLACFVNFEEECGAKETLEALDGGEHIQLEGFKLKARYKECYPRKGGVRRNGRGRDYNIGDTTTRSRHYSPSIAKRGPLLNFPPPAVGELVLEQDPSASNATTNAETLDTPTFAPSTPVLSSESTTAFSTGAVSPAQITPRQFPNPQQQGYFTPPPGYGYYPPSTVPYTVPNHGYTAIGRPTYGVAGIAMGYWTPVPAMVYSPYSQAAGSPYPESQVQHTGYGLGTGHRPHAPVCPTGYYQAPDGGMTFVYPSEVIDKYLSTKSNAGMLYEHRAASSGPTSAPSVAYPPHPPAPFVTAPYTVLPSQQPMQPQQPVYAPGPYFHHNPCIQHSSPLPPQTEAYHTYNRGYDGGANGHVRRPYTAPGSG